MSDTSSRLHLTAGRDQVPQLLNQLAELEQRSELSEEDAVHLVVVSFQLALSLLASGEFSEGIAVFDRLIERHWRSDDLGLRQGAAWGMSLKADAFFERGDRHAARTVLAELVQRFRDDPDATIRGVVMKAQVREALLVADDGRLEQALRLFDEVLRDESELVRLGGDRDTQEIAVAFALAEKARVLWRLGRLEDALATQTEFLRRFSDSVDPEIRADLGSVLAWNASTLAGLGMDESVLDPVNRLLREFPSGVPSDQSAVVDAVNYRTISLFRLGRPSDALASSKEFVERCWDLARPNQRMSALDLLAASHLALGETDDALAVYDQALEMRDEVDGTSGIAVMMLGRAEALRIAGQHSAAQSALAELVATYRDDPDADVQAVVADAKGLLANR